MKKLLLLSFFLLASLTSIAQAPIISYESSNNSYAVGTAIAPLVPINTGGAVSQFCTVSTFAGSGSRGYADGTNASASFNMPFGVATDLSGNFYVADYNNHRIRKISVSGIVTTLAGSGEEGYADGTGTAAKFDHPTGVAVDNAGNVYVGDYGNRRVRKITPSGVVSTLAGTGESGSNNGVGSQATFSGPCFLVVDASGNLYVIDDMNFMVRKITPAGIVSTFANVYYPGGITIDEAENFYVTDVRSEAVMKITPSGVVSTFASVAGHSPTAIVADKFSNIYVVDQNTHCILKIISSGVVTTLAGNGLAGFSDGIGHFASFHQIATLAIDTIGNIYVADTENDRIRKLTLSGYSITPSLPAGLSLDEATGTISGAPTVARAATTYTITAKNSSGQSSCTVTIATINAVQPTVTTQAASNVTGISAIGNGNLTSLGTPNATSYGICWSSTNTMPTTSDNKMDKGAASATGAYTCIFGNLNPGTIYYARAYAVNIAGTVYGSTVSFITLAAPSISYGSTTTYTYSAGTTISTLVPTNSGGAVPASVPGTVTTLAGNGTFGSVDGTGTAANFLGVWGLATDAFDNVFVTDFHNNKIRKITPQGVVSTFLDCNDGHHYPIGLATDSIGNMYVSDLNSHSIRKITPEGIISTFAGSGTSGDVNGTGTAASFSYPHGVTVDGAGTVYVADHDNNKVRKITSSGVVSDLALGYSSSRPSSANFYMPDALIVDKFKNVYVAEDGGGSILKITPDGTVSLYTGNSTSTPPYVDGSLSDARFYGITGLAMDNAENIYVSEFMNERIRKITPSGIVSTLAGNGTDGYADGVGTAAEFYRPVGVAADAFGNLFVADQNNSRIRKINLCGYSITPSLPAGLNFDPTTGLISGTPTASSAATTYTITAKNMAGESVRSLIIGVTDTRPMKVTNKTNPSGTQTAPKVYQTSGKLMVDLSGQEGDDYTARLYDESGHAIWTKDLSGGTINSYALPGKGIYIIQLSSSNFQKAYKVIY